MIPSPRLSYVLLSFLATLHCSAGSQQKLKETTETALVAPSERQAALPPEPAEPTAPAFDVITEPLFGEASPSLVLKKSTWVLATPFADSERLGHIGGGSRVEEKAHAVNDECPTPWVEIAPRGWICVALKASGRPPSSASTAKNMRNLPGTYAIATKSTRFYKSIKAAQGESRGRVAKGDMVKRRETIELEDGSILWKTDRGEYVDPSSLKRLSGSRFRGVDLRDEHGPMLPFAFAVHAGNPKKPVLVRSAPSAEARTIRRLSRRSVVEVLETSDDGVFVRVSAKGWIERSNLRVVEKREPPADIVEDGRWIDVDLEQQLVVAYEGREAVFATLASTGKGENATPTGSFNITRKKRQTTMRSDRSKKQTYSVAVPWPVYFNEGFAFHSTYWHNNFGSPRSHGCVNLSPADAATIYRFVGPEMPAGWSVVYGHESQPGTAVHVHSGQTPQVATR
jgi:hypothetical protein